MEYNNFCPVCGYDLGFKAWDGDSASDEICPSCGIQFGYDDALGGDINQRVGFYKGFRSKWKKDGYKFHDQNSLQPNWHPEQQLNNIPKEFR